MDIARCAGGFLHIAGRIRLIGRQRLVLFLLIGCFIFPCVLRAGEPRICVAEFTEAAPVLDGDLNEACWKTAPACADFLNYGQMTVPDLKTVVKILYTRDRLFIGVQCFQDVMADVKSDFAKPDEKDQYTARYSVEFFLKPRDESGTFYQFVANINDMRFDCRHTPNKTDIEWQSGFVAKSQLLNDSWTMEFSIPAAALGVEEIRLGQVWRFALCRNNQTYYAIWPGRENQVSLLNPEAYGPMLFGGINRWWDQDVRGSLSAEVEMFSRNERLQDAYSRYLQVALRKEMKDLDLPAPMNEARFVSAFERVTQIKRLATCIKDRLEWKQQLEKE